MSVPRALSSLSPVGSGFRPNTSGGNDKSQVRIRGDEIAVVLFGNHGRSSTHEGNSYAFNNGGDLSRIFRAPREGI